MIRVFIMSIFCTILAMYALVFAVLFVLFVLKVLVPFCAILFRYSIGKSLWSARKRLVSAGEWAIVTGATDGIGRAYAEELAKDGLNIMLISRDKAKLERVSGEIRDQYKVETVIVVADFTKVRLFPPHCLLLFLSLLFRPTSMSIWRRKSVNYRPLLAWSIMWECPTPTLKSTRQKM